jgi:hypothetical protein
MDGDPCAVSGPRRRGRVMRDQKFIDGALRELLED